MRQTNQICVAECGSYARMEARQTGWAFPHATLELSAGVSAHNQTENCCERLSFGAKAKQTLTGDTTKTTGVSSPPTDQVIRTGVSQILRINATTLPKSQTARPTPRMTTRTLLFIWDGIARLPVRNDRFTQRSHPPPLPSHSPSCLL